MTFSYSNDPGSSEKDEVRFLLADTNETGHLFEDEEIQWVISKWGELYGSMEYVAAILADQVAASYASEASVSADGVSISLGPVGEQYRALAAALRNQHKSLLVGGSPDAGGISPYEQRRHDVLNFSFGTGMHDDYSAGPQDYGDQGRPYYNPENEPGV